MSELLKTIVEAFKPKKSFLSSMAGFYTIMVVTIVLWIGFLIPDTIRFFKLDKLSIDIEPLIGTGVILFSVVFLVLLLLKLHDSFSGWSEEKRKERQARRIFDDLSNPELLYLAQYLRYSSTLIAFDDADPVVGLLMDKGIIHPEVSLDSFPSFRVRRGMGQTFRISPLVYQYLSEHRQLFKKLSQQLEAD